MTVCADIKAIKKALATQLRTLSTSTGRKLNVYHQETSDLKFPCIVIANVPAGVKYHGTFGPDAKTDMTLVLLVGAGGRAEDAGNTLDELLSVGFDQPSSIADLFDPTLESDTPGVMRDNTLGGLIGSLTILEASRIDSSRDATVYEAQIPVHITTRRRAA